MLHHRRITKAAAGQARKSRRIHSICVVDEFARALLAYARDDERTARRALRNAKVSQEHGPGLCLNRRCCFSYDAGHPRCGLNRDRQDRRRLDAHLRLLRLYGQGDRRRGGGRRG